MDIFLVSLFGNREIDDLQLLEQRLAPIIKELIQTKDFVSFLIGRNGEFDVCAASLIKRERKEAGNENNDLTLILPYKVADMEYYEKYYDSIIIPSCVSAAHPKAAITVKNRWMVDQSDLVIVYSPRGSGGAYAAKRYAKRQNKRVVDISKEEEWGEKDV